MYFNAAHCFAVHCNEISAYMHIWYIIVPAPYCNILQRITTVQATYIASGWDRRISLFCIAMHYSRLHYGSLQWITQEWIPVDCIIAPYSGSHCIHVDCIIAPYSGSHCSGFTSGRVRGQVEGRGRWWSGLPTDPQSTLYITTTSFIRNPCYTIHWSTIQWIWPLELPTVYQTSFNIHWTIIYALNWTSQSKPFLKVDPQIKIHQGHPSFI